MSASHRTDEEMLEILHMRDHQGLSREQIAKKIGATKPYVGTLLRRIDQQTDEHFPPYDAEGTLPPLWWKERKAHT